MKRVLFVLMCGSLAFGLGGCEKADKAGMYAMAVPGMAVMALAELPQIREQSKYRAEQCEATLKAHTPPTVHDCIGWLDDDFDADQSGFGVVHRRFLDDGHIEVVMDVKHLLNKAPEDCKKNTCPGDGTVVTLLRRIVSLNDDDEKVLSEKIIGNLTLTKARKPQTFRDVIDVMAAPKANRALILVRYVYRLPENVKLSTSNYEVDDGDDDTVNLYETHPYLANYEARLTKDGVIVHAEEDKE